MCGSQERGHSCGEVIALRARIEALRPLPRALPYLHKRVVALVMMG